MVLHSVRPLLERFWRVDVNADVIEGLGKTARKEAQVHNIVEVCVCTVSEPFKGSNILVDAAFFHFQLFEFIRGTLVFCIINESILEVTLKDFPGGYSEGYGGPIVLHFVEPLIQAVMLRSSGLKVRCALRVFATSQMAEVVGISKD